MARDVWAGQGGATYQDAAQEFINGELVFYYSGSWQVGRMDSQVGDLFDWQVVGSPCGPAGAVLRHAGRRGDRRVRADRAPRDRGAVIDFLAQEDIYAEVAARTRNLPAHLGVAGRRRIRGRLARGSSGAERLRRRPRRCRAGRLPLPGLCGQPGDVRHHCRAREPGHRGRTERRGRRRPHGKPTSPRAWPSSKETRSPRHTRGGRDPWTAHRACLRSSPPSCGSSKSPCSRFSGFWG
jgi:hypothetical protein